MSKRIPDKPGEYYWTEWERVVTVYARGVHGRLYVRVFPHWSPVQVTPRIAGTFLTPETRQPLQ